MLTHVVVFKYFNVEKLHITPVCDSFMYFGWIVIPALSFFQLLVFQLVLSLTSGTY